MHADLGTHSAHCAADRGDLTGTVLGMVVDAPVVVQRQVPRLGRAENCGVSAVAVLVAVCPVPGQGCCAPLVQRLWVAQCLVRLWIHVVHHPGCLLGEFFTIFYVMGLIRLLSSIHVLLFWPACIVDNGNGMFLTGFAGLTHLALCSHDCRQFVRCFSCSRVAFGNLYIISTSLLCFLFDLRSNFCAS